MMKLPLYAKKGSLFLRTALLLLCFTPFVSSALADAFARGVQIDWPEFLGRHDPISEVLPTDFDSGPFLGNGMLGTTIYKSGPQQLRFEIGRSDVTDRRFDNARLPIGGMVLETVGTIQSGTLRTDLWNAEVRGEIITDQGSIHLRAYIHAEEMALRVDLETDQGERTATLEWDPAHVVVYRYENANIQAANPEFIESVTPNPDPVLGSDGVIQYCEQERAGGGSFTTAWQLDGAGEHRQLTLTVADSFPGLESRTQAVATIQQVASINEEALEQSHRAWWNAHYPASFVSVPDAQIEGFYWITMYKLASATRADRQVIDLMGPWYRSTMWPRIWWNFNIQNAYSPLYISNHLSLAESFTRFIDAKRDNFIQNALDLWEVEDAATTPHNTDYEGLVGDGILAFRHMVNPGDFTWGLHLYWQHYLYSMDSSLVTDQEQHAFYPLLKASVNLYRHLLEEDEAGQLHLPVLLSPEYGHAANNNYNLSLLRWACETLLHLNERYDLGDPLEGEWERILRDLVPYPTDENGFMVGTNLPFERSHRHWSHLQMIWPLHLFSLDDPAKRELAVRSLNHWLTVDGGSGIQGWSQAAAASIYALMGDGQKAMESIRAHNNDTRFIRPNTRFVVGSPVIESGMMASRSLQDMLIQSWGERIRIFPAMPEEWQDAAFHDLRAKGAFLVSAVRQNGKTRWVRIRSLAGEPCIVRPGFNTSFSVWPASIQVQQTAPGEFEIPLAQGEEVILYVGDVNELPVLKPVALPAASHNFWGVKSNTTFRGGNITTASDWSAGLPSATRPGVIKVDGTHGGVPQYPNGVVINQMLGLISGGGNGFNLHADPGENATWNLFGGGIHSRYFMPNRTVFNLSGGLVQLNDAGTPRKIGPANGGTLNISHSGSLNGATATHSIDKGGIIHFSEGWSGYFRYPAALLGTPDDRTWRRELTDNAAYQFNNAAITTAVFDKWFRENVQGTSRVLRMVPSKPQAWALNHVTSFAGGNITFAGNWSDGLPSAAQPGIIEVDGTHGGFSQYANGAVITQTAGLISGGGNGFNLISGAGESVTWNLFGGGIHSRFFMPNNTVFNLLGGLVQLDEAGTTRKIGPANGGTLNISHSGSLNGATATHAIDKAGIINFSEGWTGLFRYPAALLGTSDDRTWRKELTGNAAYQFNNRAITTAVFDKWFRETIEGTTRMLTMVPREPQDVEDRVLISHAFSGASGNVLHGITSDFVHPDILEANGNSANWHAAANYRADGSAVVAEPLAVSSASLVLGDYIDATKGTPNGRFELAVTLARPTSHWMSIMFHSSPNPPNDTHHGRYGNSVGGFEYTSTGSLNTRVLADTNLLDGAASGFSNPRTLTVTLDFTPASGYNGISNHGVITWSDGEFGVLRQHILPTPVSVGSIVLASSGEGSSGAGFSNLSLSQMAGPVWFPAPEALVTAMLTLVSEPGFNTLDVTFNPKWGAAARTQTTTMTGTVEACFNLDPRTGSPEVFLMTGAGMVSNTDMNFHKSATTSYDITFANMSGNLNSQGASGLRDPDTGEFSAVGHQYTVNFGSSSGTAAGASIHQDFSQEPFIVGPAGNTGTMTLSPATQQNGFQHYGVVLTLPMTGTYEDKGDYSISGVGTLKASGTLSVPLVSDYYNWISAFSGLTNDNPGVDFDNDGIPNLLEFILDGDPRVPGTAIMPAAGVTSGGDFLFVFARRMDSKAITTQTFEYSTDLVKWTGVPVLEVSGGNVAIVPNTPEADLETVTITLDGANATDVRMFGRLRASPRE